MIAQALIKNIEHDQVLDLAGQVSYQEGQVVSRTLSQSPALSLTLFAFDAGEGLSKHTAPGDALVLVLDGAALVTIGDATHRVAAGQCVVMPAGKPHAVDARERFKMLLVLVKGP